MTNTLTFDEEVKGWTSFHSFVPEYMVGMNNNFFSFKNGELYIHHSDNVLRNTYYGEQFASKVSLMVNESPSDVKELQAVSIEGNLPWDALISAYVGMVDDAVVSSIDAVEFVRKEGMWYAYARRNQDPNHLDSKSTYGIGVINSIDTLSSTIVVNGFNSSITTGDLILKSDLTPTGNVVTRSTVQGITRIGITDTTGLAVGDFVIGMKDARTEGGNLRGYTIRMDMEITNDNKVELFAVNSEVIKSYQ